jgi:hypothetical protein
MMITKLLKFFNPTKLLKKEIIKMGRSEEDSARELNRRLEIVESSARAGIESNNAILEAVSGLKAEKPSFIGRFFRSLKPKSMEVDKPAPIAVMDEAKSTIPEEIYGEPMGRIATIVPSVPTPTEETDYLSKYSGSELADTPVLGVDAHPKVRAHYEPEKVEAERRTALNTKGVKRDMAYRKFNQLCDFIEHYAPGVNILDLVGPMGVSKSTLQRLRNRAFRKHHMFMKNKVTVPTKTAKPAKPAKPTKSKTKRRVNDSPVSTIQVQPAYGGELSAVPQVTSETPDTLAITYHPEKLNVFREKALKSGNAEQIARYEELAKFARLYLTGEYYIDDFMKIFGLNKEWKFYTRFRNELWDTHTWGPEKQSLLSNKHHKKGAGAKKVAKTNAAKTNRGTVKTVIASRPTNVAPIEDIDDALNRTQSAKDNRVSIKDKPGTPRFNSIDPRSPHSGSGVEKLAASLRESILPPTDSLTPSAMKTAPVDLLQNMNFSPLWTRYGMFMAGSCLDGDSPQRYREDCTAITLRLSGLDEKTISKTLNRDVSSLFKEVFPK